MTLRFQMGREDVLEFTRQYHAASPTYRRTRLRVRLMLPAIMIVLWGITTSRSGFEWTSTNIFLGVALLWFFLYPSRYDHNVQKYCEKTIDEGSYSKNFGDCELTLSESGIQSIAPSGEGKFPWSSVDRTQLTETYLFIFLNGPIGYPIPIADIGRESAIAAYEFVNQHIESKGEQGADGKTPKAARPADLNRYNSSLSFFDPKGMRFHLPAYMTAELRGEYGFGMAFSLTQVGDYEHYYCALDSTQRQAVRQFLLFLLDDPEYSFQRPHIERALGDYWTAPPETDKTNAESGPRD